MFWNIRWVAVIGWIIYATISATAQVITAPCARLLVGLGQDSITWTASPCAGFGGYVIEGTTDLAIGFTTIATLSAATPTRYAHTNPSETLWYYRIGMLCNGVLTGLTVPISNQRPICPDLRSVSIVNSTPVVQWDPSPSTEVIGYQLYKESPYGSGDFFPYPSAGYLLSGLSYTDVGSTLLVRYAIVAVSPCNKSLLGEGTNLDGTTGPHTSMAVSGVMDACKRSYAMQWNAYEHWGEGVAGYAIWVKRNGGAWQPVDTIATNQYIYNDLQDEDQLLFRIEAIEKNGINRAFSNELPLSVVVNRPMDFLRIVGATTTTDDLVAVDWEWDEDTDFEQGAVQVSEDKTQWSDMLALPDLLVSDLDDAAINPQTERRYYRIVSTDACDNIVQSNYASNFVLTGTAKPDFVNKLSWQWIDIQYATVLGYELYRNVNGQHSLVGSFSAADSVAHHSVNPLAEPEARTCYYVIATLVLHFPDGYSRQIQSRSNVVCVQQNALAHFPNALAPDGKNNEFKPVLAFGKSITDYRLTIFDRYGGAIFETTDLHVGWDGRRGGEPMEQGVYVYIARFTQPDGTVWQQRGTVFLLR